MRLTYLLIACSVIFTSVLHAQTDAYLKLSDGGAERIRIAVLPFMPVGENLTEEQLTYGSQIAEIITADLAFTGYFTVLDTQFFPEKVLEEEKLNSITWLAIGIQAIVLGSYKITDGKIYVDAKLFSVSSSKRIYRRKLGEDVLQMRRIAHAVSDDVVKALTGESGIAQTQLAFLSNRGGAKELYLCDYDGFNTRKLSNVNSISFTPDWSPDGLYVTATHYVGSNANLVLYDLTLSQQRNLASYDGLNVAASWSPDGRRVAFVSTKDGNSEIYIMDVRTKDIERVTFNNFIDTSPTWSPNGVNLAFCSDRSGTPQIYIMDDAGANVRRISYEGKFNDEPSWSPDGTKIAYSSRSRGQFDIVVYYVVEDRTVFLTSIGNNEHPDWAPDGNHIVFSSDRLGRYQLYQMLLDGTQLRRVTNAQGDNAAAAWSPRFLWKFE